MTCPLNFKSEQNVICGTFYWVVIDSIVALCCRFVNGEYKERGLGDVKILKHKTNGKIRLILRRERVHKLACNHHVSSDMQLKCMDNTQGKAWVWYAVDFAEGTQTEEMFAIRYLA